MLIPVILSGGNEQLVSHAELQFLMDIQQVELFKRDDGWVVVGQDDMRRHRAFYRGKERRQEGDFSINQDELFSLDG